MAKFDPHDDIVTSAARAAKLLPYQRRAIAQRARFTWNNWARQTGKSHTFTLRRLLRGLQRRRTQLLLSAGERQSRELMLKVREHCNQIAMACDIQRCNGRRGMLVRQLEARLPGGVRILALPANPLTARGFTADVFLDEFAMHRDDRAIWAALLPSLLRGDGELDVASTPRGRSNLFHKLRDNPLFAAQTLTLRMAIAHGLDVNEAEIRAAMDDERLFRQEFLCEFDDDCDALLNWETVTACTDTALSKSLDTTALADPKRELFAGIDVGRVRDLTVLWLWERCGDEFATRGVIELEQTPFEEQRRVIERVLSSRSVRRACMDATGIGLPLAEWAVSRFGDFRVEAVTITTSVQSVLALRLRSLAQQRRLRIPGDEAIVNDWHAVQRVVTAAGHVRFLAARGATGHADRFWAAALGLHAAGESEAGVVEYAFDQPLQFARVGTW